MEVSVPELILHWLTFLANGVDVTQVLAASKGGVQSETAWLFAEDKPGAGECYVGTSSLEWYILIF